MSVGEIDNPETMMMGGLSPIKHREASQKEGDNTATMVPESFGKFDKKTYYGGDDVSNIAEAQDLLNQLERAGESNKGSNRMLDGLTINNKQSESVIETATINDSKRGTVMLEGTIPIDNHMGKMSLPSSQPERKPSVSRVKSEQPLAGEDFIFNQSQMSSGRVLNNL